MSSANELRVFISSTFRDLQEEREHLVKKVFPEIRSLCRVRGITFTEVDLRWGLTDEDVKLGQVIRACLEEVDKCRPYFLGITGSRYGYVPSYLDIQKDPSLLEQYPWIEDAALEGMSITEMETHFALLGVGKEITDREPAERARFYFRLHGESSEEEEDGEMERLEEYQERVEASGAPIEKFRDPVALGAMIYDDLVGIIQHDFAEVSPPSPLEIERSRHSAFSLSRRRAYIANPVYLKTLNDHAKGDGPPLVLYAESGSGKSSLFAFWAEQFRRKNPDAHVIEHYVGIGATSTDHYAVIRHLCMEVKERFGREEEIPSDPKDLERAFGAWLGYAEHELAKSGANMVLILDGLNQLQGQALELHWIPEVIAPSIRLIISSTVEGTLLKLRERSWNELGMQPLSEAEREAIVVRYLAEFRKSLNAEQITKIASDHKSGHPLFLKTLLEEIRMIGRHEDLDQQIDHYLETTGTEDLFQRVIGRMEEDHGTETVRTILSLIELSESGLDEREISEITGISRLKVTAIITGLDYHLVRKAGVLTFFHDYLRRAVEKRYLMESRIAKELRAQMIDYFRHQELTPRTAQEVVWLLRESGDAEELATYLSHLSVLQTLYRGDRIYDIQSTWRELVEGGHDVVTLYRASVEEYLRQGETNEQKYESLKTVCQLLKRMSYPDAAADLAGEMVRIAEEMNDRRRVASAEMLEAELYRTEGSYDRALEIADRLSGVFEELEDKPSLAIIHHQRGKIYAKLGDYVRALQQYEHALTTHQELGRKSSVAILFGSIGILYFRRGDNDRALEHFEKALRIHQDLGRKSSVARLVGNIGAIHKQRGDHDRALEHFQEALRVHQDLGEKSETAGLLGNIGYLYMNRSDYERGLECFEKALRLYEEIGQKSELAHATSNIGRLYWYRGDHDRSLEYLQKALMMYREIGEKSNVARMVGSIGTIYMERGDHDRALEQYEKALIVHQELGEKIDIAFILRYMGIVYTDRGDYDRALPSYEKALALFEETESRSSVGCTLGNIGDLYLERGEYDRALASMQKGLTIARELGEISEVQTWTNALSRVLLQICRSRDDAPLYLSTFVPDLNLSEPTEEWKEITLRRARTFAEESLQLAEELNKSEHIVRNSILLARLDEAEGRSDLARRSLQVLLNEREDEVELAACHYWLWTFDRSDQEHRTEALRLYTDLLEKRPKQEYRDRFNELNQPADSE